MKPVAVVHVVKITKTVVKLAPADEYFGPMKMSVLGIRNEIHDLAIRYDVRADGDHALAKAIMGTAVMTEASLSDWEKKYPGDNQLPRDVYLMQHLYAKIDSDDARNKAKYCANWLFVRYKSSWYAKNLHQTLARDTTAPAKPTTDAAPAAAQPATSGAASTTPTGTIGTAGTTASTGNASTGSTTPGGTTPGSTTPANTTPATPATTPK